MRLISLEMQGFKSFPDRTKIKFNRGSTVIVGPNGSGKSNITDAMRWVLGEISSKNIRGTKMEDVVFAGADGKSPMGYAEVSVTFDNTDDNSSGRIDLPYDEVTVTRRYYRAGESEYFINRRAVRLRDINELFMNTGIGREGYSIVGQGRIAEIISRKGEERRAVFEDAAGIAKYRFKYRETERQLSSVDDNMQRLGDILSEVEGRVEPLSKEAEKARKYLDLYEKSRRADISLSVYDLERLQTEGREANDAYLLSEHELELITGTVEQLEAQSERLSESFSENKLASERVYDEIKKLNAALRELDMQYADITSKIEHSMSRSDEYKKSAEDASGQLESVAAEQDEVVKKIEELKAAKCDKETQIAELREQLDKLTLSIGEMTDKIEALFTQIRKNESEEVDLRVRINVIRESMKDDGEKNNGVAEEIKKYESEADELLKKVLSEEENIRLFDETLSAADTKIRALSESIRELEESGSKIKASRDKTASEIAAADSRIDALTRLEESFEGYGKSVKYVMDGVSLHKIKGTVYGPVSRLINVPSEYVTAIEVALGASLQNIVVDCEDTAKECIYYLKNGGAGRATFYPLSAVKAGFTGRETENARSFPGYIGLASELIGYDEKYAEVIKYLLGRTCVFDTIDSASRAAKSGGYKIRAVTLDGQQINAGGSFTGGSVRRDSGMLTRAGEIRSLRAERSLLSRELTSLDEKLEASKKRISDAERELSDEKNRRDITDAMKRASMSAKDNANAKREASLSLAGELKADLETRQTQKGRSECDLKELSEAERTLCEETEKLKGEREELNIKANADRDRQSEANEKLSELALDLTRLNAEISAGEEMLSEKKRRESEYGASRESYLERAAELDGTCRELQANGEENRKSHDELKGRLDTLEGERSKLEAGSLEFEKRQGELYKKIREKTDEKEKVVRTHMKNEQKKQSVKEGYDKIISHLWDEYELTYTTAAELDYPKIDEKSRAVASKELSSCKSALKALGNVNVGAVDEYNEVRERYENLSRQMADLTASREDLNLVIEELQTEMQTEFSEAFAKINEKFGEVFRELFGGGEAEVYLSDPDDVLSSGIEIKAAPPGKVIKNLSLLSGGEQAFVGIALLFAMIQVNPTPFCIFDEIESALDEVNVARFADYVRRYSDHIQFVVITHRRGTMERADSLYGVTMPRHGISRVLTLDPKGAEADEYVTDGKSES